MIVNKRGLFITVEGPDGAGKSSLVAAIKGWLQQTYKERLDVLYVREPGGTPVGEAIRQILLDNKKQMTALTEAYLFAASRAELSQTKIKPHLANGGIVISDRYVNSSLAYQGGGRELGIEQVAKINAWATEDVATDLCLLLMVDPQTGMARQQQRAVADRLEQAGAQFALRVKQAYQQMALQMPADKVVMIDANKPFVYVFETAQTAIKKLITSHYGPTTS